MTRETNHSVCLTMHAERLDTDAAWKKVQRASLRLTSRRGRGTIFVSTRHARIEGIDLGPRLDWLADAGHEIAMHTHYRPASTTQEERRATKGTEPGTAEVIDSLDADYAYLSARGHTPRGFSAGAWRVHPAATEWLAGHGFTYDCSFRSYALTHGNAMSSAGDDHTCTSRVHGVLQIPTTATNRSMLRGALRGELPSLPLHDTRRYSLAYLHDYDLVAPSQALAFALIVRRLRGAEVMTVGELARRIESS